MLPLFFGFFTVKSLELFTTGKRNREDPMRNRVDLRRGADDPGLIGE